MGLRVHAANVLVPVRGPEAQVPADPGADFVAVEQVAESARIDEPAFEFDGEGRFPGSAQSREPDGHRSLSDQLRTLLRRYFADDGQY